MNDNPKKKKKEKKKEEKKKKKINYPPVDGVHDVIKILMIVSGLGDFSHELSKKKKKRKEKRQLSFEIQDVISTKVLFYSSKAGTENPIRRETNATTSE